MMLTLESAISDVDISVDWNQKLVQSKNKKNTHSQCYFSRHLGKPVPDWILLQ